MKKSFILAGLLSATCMVGAASAAPVQLDVTLFIVEDNTVGNGFVGQTGTIRLNWDDADVTAATPDLVGVPAPAFPGLPAGPAFSFEITDFFGAGQTFTQLNDPNAILGFGDGSSGAVPVSMDLSISETEFTDSGFGLDVPITDPRVLSFNTSPVIGENLFFDVPGGGGGLGLNIIVNDIAPIPLPASALLLGAGILGAGAVMRRRQKTS